MVQEPQRRLDCVRGVLTGKKTHLVSLWVSRERGCITPSDCGWLNSDIQQGFLSEGGGEGRGLWVCFQIIINPGIPSQVIIDPGIPS